MTWFDWLLAVVAVLYVVGGTGYVLNKQPGLGIAFILYGGSTVAMIWQSILSRGGQ